ncbi:hypothetical protein [Mangrovibacterium lignilyticum]|uniref:hypothetical protein n=1 Tax=Mangrovibacterium lignilyticum TaxID=2668052 RepID=UPI0013D131D9|nr:hypothetical protein [Mangrovibacterium lignilyticum]
MKNKFRFLLSLVLFVALFSGCGKDDDEKDTSNPSNYFKVDGKYYELKVGYLQNWGMDEGFYEGYNTDLVLVSDGFSLGGESLDLSGAGDALYFEMYSSQSDQLDVGDYVYSSSEPYPTGSFDYGEYYIGYDISTDEYDDAGFFTNGTVSVSKSGSTYEITVVCTTSTGKSVTGYFKGSLTVLDLDLFGMSKDVAVKTSFMKNRQLVQ